MRAPDAPSRHRESAAGGGAPNAAAGTFPRRQKIPAIKSGDLVMCGSHGISMPSDFFVARVLWTDGVVENALKVATIDELFEFKRTARKRVEKLCRKVQDAERKLGDARRAVWAALEQMGASKSGGGRP